MNRKTIDELERVSGQAVEILQSTTIIEEAMPNLLSLLAVTTGSEWATYWQVDPIAYLLRPITTWSAISTPNPKLEQDTRSRTLSLSEGNAGHVWRSRKPIWTTDLVKDMCLPRSLDANESGLRGGIWFALKSERVVYGVIELLGKDIPNSTDDSLLAIERLGIKLGLLIEKNTPSKRA